MLGKTDGLRLLDLSADGFWNSFFAIVVAAPALIVGWVGIANEIGDPDAFAGRFGMLMRLATVDIGSWVLPLVALALVAPRAGIGDRFVHYVVASNWASAITRLADAALGADQARPVVRPSQVSSLVSLFLFALSMVLTWRMTNAVDRQGRGGRHRRFRRHVHRFAGWCCSGCRRCLALPCRTTSGLRAFPGSIPDRAELYPAG